MDRLRLDSYPPPPHGIPVRMNAVKQLANSLCSKPRPIDCVTIALPAADYKPEKHRGGLRRVSPEEITAAYIIAIKRDIDNNESDQALTQWRTHMLSTSFRFVLLPTQQSRYWFALDQREQMDHQYRVCHRSCFQRLHEVIRLVERMQQALAGTTVTAAMVEQEYKKNLPTMVNGPGQVTFSFVDSCLTIHKRMFISPIIRECLRDMDDRAACGSEGTDGRSFSNPFDLHSRLHAIIEKC